MQFLCPILRLVKASRRDDQLLLPLAYREFFSLFKKAALQAQLHALDPVPYQLRHGGVSHDLQQRVRDLASAKARGRWLSDSSMKRYEKHGRLTAMLHRLPPAVQARCRKMTEILPQLFAGNCMP